MLYWTTAQTHLTTRPLGWLHNKVIKLLYDLIKADNHLFSSYQTHYKEKLKMKKSTYDPCFLFGSELLVILGIQPDNTLILADSNFGSNLVKTFKLAKIMIKNRKYLTLANLLKFNCSWIKIEWKNIILNQKIHIEGVFFVTNNATIFISFTKIRRKNS